MGVRLPAEYQEVEYLEATGTQAFFTDVPIQEGLTVDSVQTFNGGDTYLFGGYNGKSFQASFNGQYKGRAQSSYSGFYFWGSVYNNNETIYHVVLTQKNGEQIGVLNGSQVLSGILTAKGDTSAGEYAVMFGQRNSEGQINQWYRGKVYSCKVSKGNELLANYVPCYRKSDNKPGMYDTVLHKFYVNERTGNDFIVGPDVIDSISPLMVAWRRMLMRPSLIPTGYVTDGLLLWLDAKCNTRHGHDENSLYWEDLSANHRDYAIGESGLIFGQSVASFTTASHKPITTEKAFTEAERQQINDNFATLEIGVNFAGSGYQIVLPLGNKHGTINFWKSSDSVKFLSFNPALSAESVSLLDGLHGYNSELWVDGVKQESANFHTTWTIALLNLMFSYSTSGSPYSFLGDIAYIRVYNRRLTDAELMQNWLKDKARYNL